MNNDDIFGSGMTAGIAIFACLLLISLLILGINFDVSRAEFYKFCLQKNIPANECVIDNQKPLYKESVEK